MPRLRWTRDRIVLEIRRLHARGEPLTARHMRAMGLGGMVTTAYKLFGGWREAIAQAGAEAPERAARSWTVERIVAEVHGMAARGQDLSYSAAREANPRVVAAAYRSPELGNWRRALEAAGLAPEAHQRRRAWTRQAIIAELRRLAAEGGPLSFGAARAARPDLVAAACSRRHFGSWERALGAAGLDYEHIRRRRRWTRERIIAAIKHLHAGGAPLTTTALRRRGWAGLVAAARKPAMFGSWREAVECAGIDYEQARRDARERSDRR